MAAKKKRRGRGPAPTITMREHQQLIDEMHTSLREANRTVLRAKPVLEMHDAVANAARAVQAAAARLELAIQEADGLGAIINFSVGRDQMGKMRVATMVGIQALPER